MNEKVIILMGFPLIFPRQAKAETSGFLLAQSLYLIFASFFADFSTIIKFIAFDFHFSNSH
jgi:hypothetical protein